MQYIQVYYISLSGNTTDFLKRVNQYICANYGMELNIVNIKDKVKDGESIYFQATEPYFSFLPAYLEGGNGLDTGFTEILTTPLKEFIAYKENRKLCFGIIGSGNRNFNKQFCLTAYQYADTFGFPVIDEFELRGTNEDVERISDKMVAMINDREGVK